PLTAVLGYIDLLDQQIRDPIQRKWVATIRRSGWSLLRLLSDIVDFARIDAGEIRLEFGVLDPVGKVHSILDLFRPTMDEKGLRAEVQVATGVPRAVIGDAARMRQVLSNLIGNAVKFTRDGTIGVAIAAEPADADGQVRLSFTVTDSGVGIAPENLPTLFDRFSQADSSSTRPYGGAGLGLAIARGLARRMGGEVTAESAGLGHGARFRLVLPVRSATRAAAAPAEGAPGRTRARGTVLVIEDDPVNQELLAEMVRILGFTAEVAGTGELGVEAAAGRPDLAALLVDVNLPGMNGLDAIRHIRALASPAARAPILCVSALASDSDRATALAAGADAYLTKPVRLADLRQAMERETARRRPPEA
ncbi:hybrid sensor histidine kinase/response regulator, partial [Stella sp.]|uniref:ATP-binding response regulator n=1 Tax=Stella sp. TaxID=2912054 RepID=UPI0035AE02CE